MKYRVKLLLLVIAMPLITIFVSGYVSGDYENQWHTAVVKELGTTAAAKMPPLATVCTNPKVKADIGSICRDLTILRWMKGAAIGTGVLGLALLSLIFLAGRIARNRRTWLVPLFGPLLRVTVMALVVLIVLHGALTMASLWYGESALAGVVHIQLILLIGAGALAGVSAMVRSTMRAVQKIVAHVLGVPLTRGAYPELWRFVDDLARRVGTEPPAHIVAGLLPTFFVTEADVICPAGTVTGRTLFVSPSFCRILGTGELAAIIGHELGHFRGEDTAFSRRFYPIYRGAQNGLEALARSGRGGAAMLGLLPAIYVLAFFLESFATTEGACSRERELAADQAGAEAAGLTAMGTALVKVHAFQKVWEKVQADMKTELAWARRLENASLHFARISGEQASPAAVEKLDEQRLPHPTDSHPPLSMRLEALSLSLPSLQDRSLQLSPEDPSIRLFGAADQLEAELTELENQFLVDTRQVRVGSAVVANTGA